MGFQQVLDNLTFKCMAALRIQIQSLVDYVWSYCLGYMRWKANFDNDCKD